MGIDDTDGRELATGTRALTLRFGSPEHGWLVVELVGPEGASRLDASDVPGDSLTALVDAARDLVEGLEPRPVTWFLEPAEVTWYFGRTGAHCEVSAQRDADAPQRIGAGTVDAIALLVWRALRRLEVAPAWTDRTAAWSHAFPSRQVAELGTRLRGRRPAR